MKKNEVSLNIGKKAHIRQYFPDRYDYCGCSYYCSVGAQRDNGSCRVIPGCYVLNYAHKRNAIEGQNNVPTTSIEHYCLDLHYHHAHGIKAAAAPPFLFYCLFVQNVATMVASACLPGFH